MDCKAKEAWEYQKSIVKYFCDKNSLEFRCRENEWRGGFLLKNKIYIVYTYNNIYCEIDLTDEVECNFIKSIILQISTFYFAQGEKNMQSQFKSLLNI